MDREIGSVIGQGIPNVPKLFTYARYNVELSRERLDALNLEYINPCMSSKWILSIISAKCKRSVKRWLSK